jgi:two-component system cell cycle sensor histidine kinase/response regulator CckA
VIEVVNNHKSALIRHQGQWQMMESSANKLSEEALKQERDFIRSVVNTAQTIILTLDKEGRILEFNPYMEQISGYRLDEVKGKDWFTTFLPKRDQEGMRKLFAQAIGDIQTRGNINPLLTKDGIERDIEWFDKTLKDASGNIIGLICVGQDITERKRIEEELHAAALYTRSLIEANLDPLVTISVQGKITDVNRATEVATGIPREDIIGTDFWDYFTKPEEARKGYHEVLGRPQLPSDATPPFRYADGSAVQRDALSE